jgi:hypothetical protein
MARWLTLEEEERLLAASPPWLQQLIVLLSAPVPSSGSAASPVARLIFTKDHHDPGAENKITTRHR